MDNLMIMYSTFGGQLRYIVNLHYCTISIATINGYAAAVVKPSKLDIHGFGLFPLTFYSVKPRECADWILAMFSAKRSI